VYENSVSGYFKISGDKIVKVLEDEVPLNEEGVIGAGDKSFKKADLIYCKVNRNLIE